MKRIYNESFIHFDDAVNWLERHLLDHSGMFVLEAKLHYINGGWNAACLFDDVQKELELDE